MDILGVPLWLLFLSVFMASLVWYCWHMSKDLNVFERLGITGPPPFPIVGNLGFRYWLDGMFESQKKLYNQYGDRKFYGAFDANTPVLHIKDCDMIRDILVTHFDHFSDRPNRFHGDPLTDKCTHYLKGDKWRNTREVVGSALNPTFLEFSTSIMQRTSNALMNYLKPKIDWRRKLELSGFAFLYTADVQSGIVFNRNFKTFENVYGKNVNNLENLLSVSRRWRLFSVFFPFMSTILRVFRISVVPKSALKYFNQLVDKTLEKCESKANDSKNKQCLLGAMATGVFQSGRFIDDNGNDNREGIKNERGVVVKLSRPEIQAQAFTFMHSGLEKVSSILSLVLFQLANNPYVCETVQREIDHNIGTLALNEKNIESLVYLDQCINETIRMFPPYISIERICTKDITIQGVRIPKDMIVRVPVYSLHHDSNIWTDPDEFCPERFDPTHSSASRHPFAYLPFGMGPRSCLGMRLAMLELKTVLVCMLRVVTPIPCGQTVYPVKLQKWKMEPEGELWVKVRPRFWLGVCEYPPSSVLS